MSQIFKKPPTEEVFNRVLGTFGIAEYSPDFSFRKKDLETMGTVQLMKEIIPQLSDFYYPYKMVSYLKDLSLSKCITILRQFLRNFGYSLFSRERYVNGEKYIQYSFSDSFGGMKTKSNVVINL